MNEKLIINTNLLRKESEFKTKSCAVEKAIAVSHAEFENLKRHPLQDNDLIAENTDLMYCDSDDIYHCLLIYDEEQGDGLLVEAEGASYARYAQYIPNAKLLYENHMQTHLQEMKFYCPLEINRVPECWDVEEYEEISSYEASAYESEINHFISDFNLPEEKERGLMHWYNGSDPVNQKIRSAFMSVEERNGELMGVITAQVYGKLTAEELEDFRAYCSGQLSDGVGESLEQRPIKTPDGEIYVSFWNSDEWFLQTEEEMNGSQSEDMTERTRYGNDNVRCDMIYNENKVEMLRQRYPEGTRICLDHMEDLCPVESGTCGTVQFVDDAGTLHCKFDDGRMLGVIPHVDKFHKIDQEQTMSDAQTEENIECEEITETEDIEESEEMEMSM